MKRLTIIKMKRLTKKKAIEFGKLVLGVTESKIINTDYCYNVTMGQMFYNFWKVNKGGKELILCQHGYANCVVYYTTFYDFETLVLDYDIQEQYENEIKQEVIESAK